MELTSEKTWVLITEVDSRVASVETSEWTLDVKLEVTLELTPEGCWVVNSGATLEDTLEVKFEVTSEFASKGTGVVTCKVNSKGTCGETLGETLEAMLEVVSVSSPGTLGMESVEPMEGTTAVKLVVTSEFTALVLSSEEAVTALL